MAVVHNRLVLGIGKSTGERENEKQNDHDLLFCFRQMARRIAMLEADLERAEERATKGER